MVRKRGLDNCYERSRKRSSLSHPPTESNKEKNLLNDNLLNLYRQQIVDIKDTTSNQNEVIMEDNNNENIRTDKLMHNKSGQTKQLDANELNAQLSRIKELETTLKAYDKKVAELLQANANLQSENKLLRNAKENDVVTEKGLNPENDELKNVESPKTPPKSVKKRERNNSKALTLKYSSITFDDVGGMSKEYKEIFEVCMGLKESYVYQEKDIPPTRGCLLHGPPGCGKTHLVHAIAGELQLPLVEIVATEFVSGTPGETKSKIREAFDLAIKIGKCILFIDNIEIICPKKEERDKDLQTRIVAQILNGFDELNENDINFNVKVMGATNMLDYIDPSLRKGGRFDEELAIGIPNEDSRLKIIEVLWQNVNLGPGVDLAWVAHNTPGFVADDLKQLIIKVRKVRIHRIRKELCTSNYTDDSCMKSVRHGMQSISDEDPQKRCLKFEDFKIALRKYVPYCKREGFASVPDVTWDDIGALEDVKKILRSCILWPVKHRKFYKKNHLDYTKGILLYGPKGCGKTLLAKAIANECNINFLPVNGSQLLDKYLGESEKQVIKCFQRAKYAAPCVIFFDEFDAFCPARSDSVENAAAERVVNQLLAEMDGVQGRKEVFVIAATNRYDKIDSAMRRSGRLTKAIYVDLPSPVGRLEILKGLTRNKTRPKIADEVDLKTVAFDPRCNDFSGADLSHLIKEATSIAVNEIMDTVDISSESNLALNWNHFENALNIVKPSVTEEDKEYFKKQRLQNLTCT